MSIRAQTPAVTSAPSGGAEQRLHRVLALGMGKLRLDNAAAAPTGLTFEEKIYAMDIKLVSFAGKVEDLEEVISKLHSDILQRVVQIQAMNRTMYEPAKELVNSVIALWGKALTETNPPTITMYNGDLKMYDASKLNDPENPDSGWDHTYRVGLAQQPGPKETYPFLLTILDHHLEEHLRGGTRQNFVSDWILLVKRNIVGQGAATYLNLAFTSAKTPVDKQDIWNYYNVLHFDLYSGYTKFLKEAITATTPPKVYKLTTEEMQEMMEPLLKRVSDAEMKAMLAEAAVKALSTLNDAAGKRLREHDAELEKLKQQMAELKRKGKAGPSGQSCSDYSDEDEQSPVHKKPKSPPSDEDVAAAQTLLAALGRE